MKKFFSASIILILIAIAMTSCFKKQDSNVISREFPKEQWGRFVLLETDFEVVKAPITADLVMEIAVTDEYPSLYPSRDANVGLFTFMLSVIAPDGSKRVREYSFHLKDDNGKFKSEKVDGYYHFELPIINEMRFREVGKYHFKIENKYSKDPLYGIKSLDVKCLQIKRL